MYHFPRSNKENVRLPTEMKSPKKEYCVSMTISIPIKDLSRLEAIQLHFKGTRSAALMKIMRAGFDTVEEQVSIETVKQIEFDRKLQDIENSKGSPTPKQQNHQVKKKK